MASSRLRALAFAALFLAAQIFPKTLLVLDADLRGETDLDCLPELFSSLLFSSAVKSTLTSGSSFYFLTQN